MKQLSLKVAPRETRGFRAAGRLRRSGHVPAIIYGKSGSRPLSIDDKDLRMLLRECHGGAALVIVNDGKSEALSILQEVKRNPRTDCFMHVDFHEIDAKEPLHIYVPVHTKGEAPGVRDENGMLQVVMHRIELKALPKDLPSSVEVDVSALKLGQAIHVSELPAIAGVSFLAESDAVVVMCDVPKVIEEPVAAVPADGAAPAADGKTAAPAKAAAAKTDAKPAKK
ncbi:MAG TPA: 50S ribosomal protein L25 [Opitutales bacterium]|nr:50S ribosomal protein L25 [Opitutales bacterium]